MHQHTFVILAYRQSPYLEACIESLLRQTMPSKIVISTSTPSSWLKEVGARHELPIMVRTGEGSIADDWNFALSLADTPLVTLAHQDDLYHPAYSEAVLRLADRFPDMLISFTNNDLLVSGRLLDRTLNLTIQRLLLWPFRLRRHICSRLIRRLTLSFGNPICCPSVTYHRTCLNRLPGGFAFDRTYPNNLDWEAWIRLAAQPGAFVYEKSILMTHRFHEESETSGSLADKRRQSDDRRIFGLLWPRPLASAIASLYALAYRSRHS